MIFPIPDLNELFTPNRLIKGISSIWGDFGVGKTTFALQTAFNASKRKKKILYIYSKPEFPYEKIGNIFKNNSNEGLLDTLENITFIQIANFSDLFTLTFNLEFLIIDNIKKKEDNLNIIIIDSITDLYRLELDRDNKEKNVNLNYQLNNILATLFFINETYNIEILIINEVSRKNQNGQTIEIQTGGNVMDYWVFYAFKIARTGKINERIFTLTKHPEEKKLEFISQITESGFE